MKIINSVAELRNAINSYKTGSTGFVPTMGALHQGHLSLVRQSVRDTDHTVVSIFVNPTQFNDPADLENYPRNTEVDIDLLKSVLHEDDILFMPAFDELYSNETEVRINLGNLDRVMEGKHRPGHFRGVVRVVKLLFEAVRPARAYFGQKDFQQLAIIREMVKQLGLGIEIIGCPVVREVNGLAMSSRNERLDNETRKKASVIYNTLLKYSTINSRDELALALEGVPGEIDREGIFKTEYFEIVDSITLTPIKEIDQIKQGSKYYGCIAVFAGEVRLIDNHEFSFAFIKG